MIALFAQHHNYTLGGEAMNNLLITGALHEDRLQRATALSMAWLCLKNEKNHGCGTCHNCLRVLAKCHPNITYIEPAHSETEEGEAKNLSGDIKIDQVRSIITENQKANYEDGLAIFIITHIHQITKGAANALLKSIEESGAKKVFIGLAPSRTSVLPTIASRLISVFVKPSLLTKEPDENIVKKINAITQVRPTQRFKLCEQFSSSRAELLVELENIHEECHTLLRSFYEPDNPHHLLHPVLVLSIGNALSHACDLLERNINPRLVVEQLILRDWPYA